MRFFVVLGLVCVGLVPTAFAQIVIDRADVETVLGQSFTFETRTNLAPDVSALLALVAQDGPNQTWDLTGFTYPSSETNTQMYLSSAAGTPGANDAGLANANYVIENLGNGQGATSYQYYLLNDNGFENLGDLALSGSVQTKTTYTPARLFFVFPYTYQSGWNLQTTAVTTGPQGTQSIPYTETSIADSYGTIITPVGTRTVLRAKTTLTFSLASVTTTVTSYNWFGNAVDPVASMSITEVNIPGIPARTTYSISYQAPSTSQNPTAPTGAPVAVAPDDGNGGVEVAPTLVWTAVQGATTYDVEVATDTGFGDIVYSSTGQATVEATATGLEEGTTYYWRARGVNAGGVGPWSATFSFTTQNVQVALVAPALVSPADGAQDLGDDVSLEWAAVPGAAAYALQVATDEAFTSVAFGVGDLPDTSVLLTNVLDPGTTYYWRVRGTTTETEGPWSDAFSFTTQAAEVALTAPALSSPADGAQNLGADISFTWNDIPAATGYLIEIATDAEFADVVFGIDLEGTLLLLTNVLDPGITYYWRVRGTTAEAEGPWSDTFTFSTQAALIAVGLVSPADGARDIPTTVDLTWNGIEGATAYNVQVATDLNFNEVVFEASDLGEEVNEVTAAALAPTTRHFWRVRGLNAVGPGPWSETFIFTTATNVSTEPGTDVPTAFVLHGAYPNPFNPTTQIAFELPMATSVRLAVYDLLGREVTVLVTGPLSAGQHVVTWNAGSVPGGTYLYRLDAGTFTGQGTVTLVK